MGGNDYQSGVCKRSVHRVEHEFHFVPSVVAVSPSTPISLHNLIYRSTAIVKKTISARNDWKENSCFLDERERETGEN